MKRTILVIDDDERLLFLISALLQKNNFEVMTAKSAKEARSILSEESIDALVVDWMLPKETGVEFIKNIRGASHYLKNIPAIALTAVDGIDNKVTGFEAGFDDYVTKPFEEVELILRINALLKRTEIQNQDTIVEFGDCMFNLETEELIKGGEVVHLSSTEVALLKTLCLRPNQPIHRAELAKKLSFQVSDRTIDVQIARLRKKIGDESKNNPIIKTVRHVGYSINLKKN
jgi:two-component system phosphate regulon response regulator OmpR